ncbi:MAG: hypothetical protein KDE32_06505 [Novosphingobium sp.]|nr:hypothetical protein [Novosphingobium sp.]
MNMIVFNRKPVFDAVRHLIGRGFTRSEVELLDRAIDLGLDIADAVGIPELGSLSAHFESGGRGAGTVSGGQNDPGGVSYGTYQLSSRTGTVARFMESEGGDWARLFGKAVPGSAAFSRVWRDVAEREAQAFEAAQHAFIERTHYRPAVAEVLKQTGLDLDSRHRAVRDATWSVAVQHGGAARILASAVHVADLEGSRDEAGRYDRNLVNAVYAQRSAYVLRVAGRASAASARLLRSIVGNRYPAELRAALAMLDGD